MPAWKWRIVRRALESKGFRFERVTDHEFYRFYYRGKVTSIRTKISLGNKGDLHSDSPLATKIQRQLMLQKKELQGYIECPLTEEDYIEVLQGKGLLGD